MILIGHSYGGTLISEVSTDNPQVKALIYVAAAAPLAGVPFGAWMAAQPSSYQVAPEMDADGLLWLTLRDFKEGLGQDLSHAEAELTWALHKPAAAAAFGDSATCEGWRTHRCWYVVAEHDRIIPADSQRELARQMDAKVRTVASGHMVALSNPGAVVEAVEEAIAAVVGESVTRVTQ